MGLVVEYTSGSAFLGIDEEPTPAAVEADFVELMLEASSRGRENSKVISIGWA